MENAKSITRSQRKRRIARRKPLRGRLVRPRLTVDKISKLLRGTNLNSNPNTITVDNAIQPTVFRQYKDKSALLSVLQQYHAHTRGEYLTSLVHPDLAVQNGLSAKLPTDLPIPTASIGFHTQHQFSSSSIGTFLLSWRPGVFATLGGMGTGYGFGNFTFNNNVTLTGTTTNPNNAFQLSGVYPPISLQRYRTVSALLKISYNGSVLNQSGTMLGCATFDPFGVYEGTPTAFPTSNDPLVDRFGNFTLIQNGLWNRTVNITRDADGMECLYVPMDPDDQIFQKVDTYYGNNIGIGITLPDDEGAHINYVVAGRNLPANTSCIMVDCYYNFEVIADPASAYLLKSTVDESYRQSDKTDLYNTLKDVAKSGGLIKGAQSSSSSKWTDILMKAVEMGVGYIPTILGTI